LPTHQSQRPRSPAQLFVDPATALASLYPSDGCIGVLETIGAIVAPAGTITAPIATMLPVVRISAA